MEVGDTDRADELLFDEVLEGLPRFLNGDIDGNDTMVNTVLILVGPTCGVMLGVVDVLDGDGEVDQEEVEITREDGGV